jgi:hypothetical protein
MTAAEAWLLYRDACSEFVEAGADYRETRKAFEKAYVAYVDARRARRATYDAWDAIRAVTVDDDIMFNA